MPWIGAVVCIAFVPYLYHIHASLILSVSRMVNFSMVVSGSAAVTYLLDTHKENALNILAVTNFIKNMILYGFTFFSNGMIAKRGVKVSLLIFAGCQAVCWLSCIPMYIYGKRVRSYVRIPDRLVSPCLTAIYRLLATPTFSFPVGRKRYPAIDD